MSRQANWRFAQKHAAMFMNVSVRSVQRASRVLRFASPAVCDAIMAGRMSLAAAEEILDLPHWLQDAIAGLDPLAIKRIAGELRRSQ